MERTRRQRLKAWTEERRMRFRRELAPRIGAAGLVLFILVYGAMLDVHLGLGAGSVTGFAELSEYGSVRAPTNGFYILNLQRRMWVRLTVDDPAAKRFSAFVPGFFFGVREAMERAGYDRDSLRPITPAKPGLNSGRALPIPRCRVYYAGIGRRVATRFELLPP